MGKFMNEFKEFAMRGNVVDMAVGVVIGGAFGKIVTSFVNDVLMPPLGQLLGGSRFTELKVVLQDAVMQGGEVVEPEVAILYGSFIQTIVDFLIVAFAIFLMIKGINKLKREKPAEPEAPAEPSAEVKLLSEIRDLLDKK
ncbi:MAG: large-conductance mechanosensitive channel protein MscL [Porphyromonas sp.]|nr:large-conductance mechanosensitive channel protein MscL [Porphyromonas sp.]